MSGTAAARVGSAPGLLCGRGKVGGETAAGAGWKGCQRPAAERGRTAGGTEAVFGIRHQRCCNSRVEEFATSSNGHCKLLLPPSALVSLLLIWPLTRCEL